MQVRRQKSKPSQKVLEKQMVDRTKAVTKKQQAAKQQAAKAKRAATRDNEAAKAYEVSSAVLICTHHSKALQTTMEWMAALQVIRPVRRGTGATGAPVQLPPK